MPLAWHDNWNGIGVQGYPNHDSDRSKAEVERLILSVPTEAPTSALAIHVMMNSNITVMKGIHQRVGHGAGGTAHIRVFVADQEHHINLERSAIRWEDNSFVWKVHDVT